MAACSTRDLHSSALCRGPDGIPVRRACRACRPIGLGGQREVALATYMAARLAHDLLPDHELDPTVRVERAVAAKSWLSTVTLQASVRTALVRLVEASTISRPASAAAVRAVLGVAGSQLDKGARAELEQLAEELERK